MKKRILIFILALLVFFVIFFNISDFNVFNQKEKRVTGTGEVITGNATSAGLSFTITVTGSPTLNLLKPKNETYITDKDLELNFTAYSADNIWYKLDSDSNVTITSNTTFNTTSGQHTLYLFANNTYGNSSKNVTFTINKTKLVIKYDNYKDNGSSTDFNKSSFEELQNKSETLLEKINHGKIYFNEKINITEHINYTDNVLDLDSHTNISYNFIEINSTALPNFNKSAILYLYNLTFLMKFYHSKGL